MGLQRRRLAEQKNTLWNSWGWRQASLWRWEQYTLETLWWGFRWKNSRWFFELWSWTICHLFLLTSIFFLNEYRGVFVLILGWIIKLLKLPKKLYRNLKSLILGNVRFLWLLLWHYEFIDIAFFFMVICLDGSLSVHWTLRNFFCVYVWQNPPCAHPSSGLAVVVKFLFLFRI